MHQLKQLATFARTHDPEHDVAANSEDDEFGGGGSSSEPDERIEDSSVAKLSFDAAKLSLGKCQPSVFENDLSCAKPPADSLPTTEFRANVPLCLPTGTTRCSDVETTPGD